MKQMHIVFTSDEHQQTPHGYVFCDGWLPKYVMESWIEKLEDHKLNWTYDTISVSESLFNDGIYIPMENMDTIKLHMNEMHIGTVSKFLFNILNKE